jgi:hypothetical protein
MSCVVRLALLIGFTLVATPMPDTHAMNWIDRPDAYGCRLNKNGKVDCPGIRGTFDFNLMDVPKKPRVCKWEKSKRTGTYKCRSSTCLPEQWWCHED